MQKKEKLITDFRDIKTKKLEDKFICTLVHVFADNATLIFNADPTVSVSEFADKAFLDLIQNSTLSILLISLDPIVLVANACEPTSPVTILSEPPALL